MAPARGLAAALVSALALVATAPAGASTYMTTAAGGGSDPRDEILAVQTAITDPGGLTAVGDLSPSGGSQWAFSDRGGCRVRRVASAVVLHMAGNNSCGGGLPFSSAVPSNVPLRFPNIAAIGFPVSRGAGGSVLIGDADNGMVHRWVDGLVITVAGDGTTSGSGSGACDYSEVPDNVDARTEDFCSIYDVAGHRSDNLRFLFMEFRPYNQGGNLIFQVQGTTVTRVAGGGCPTPPSATSAQQCLWGWGGVDWAHDGAGFVVANYDNQTLDHFSSTNFGTSTHTVLAGAAGIAGNTGDGGPATAGRLAGPTDVVAHRDGSYLVAEGSSCRVRRIVPGGNISTFAGNPITVGGPNNCNPGPDGGLAANTPIASPLALASFPEGILIATIDDRVLLVDRTSILSGPPKVTSNPEATFTFDSTDIVPAIFCRLDPQPNIIILSPPCGDANDKSETVTLAGDGSADGEHLMQIWENGLNAPYPDGSSDTSFSEWRWTLDTQPPLPFGQLEPADGATGLVPRPTLTWEATKDVTTKIGQYEVLIDRQVTQGSGSCAGTVCTGVPDADLSEGPHTWRVQVTDQAGHVRQTAERTFSVGTAPTASFAAAPNPVLAGRQVTFDGSASSDANGPIAKFEWDLDGDGAYETDTGITSSATASYPSPGSVQIGLRVTDGVGLTATAAVTLQVNPEPVPAGQLGVSVNSGAQFTNDRNVRVLLRFPANTTQVLISNDGGFLAPQTFSPAPDVAWTLDSSGPERLPKTVYVRFLLGGLVSETFTDDIILDEIPPQVTAGSVAAGSAARAAAARRWTVKIRATDSNSGVDRVQVTANKRKPGKLLAYKRTLRVRSAAKPAYARARDRAGNYSRWKKLR